jgi:L-Ala-D/L-Glu epimerase
LSRTVASLDRAEAFRVRVPFRRPFLAAGGKITERRSWIVRLRDIDGRTGVGEVALDPGASAAEEWQLEASLRDAIRVLAAGEAPDWTGRPTSAWRAVRAGCDGAMEDLAARVAEDPQGATSVAVSVAVNATLEVSSPHVLVQSATLAVAAGFGCLKLKVGREERGAIVDRVRAVRAAVGPGIAVRLDANATLDYDTAAHLLDDLAVFAIEYLEQPLAAGDLAGHARLRRASAVPIALDESISSEAAAAAAIAAGAADVLVVKPARVGGPEVVRAIAALGAAAGVPVVLSTFFETGIGTAAAIRAASELPLVLAERSHGLGTAGLLEHDLLAESCAIAAGRITVPDTVLLDERALRRYTIDTIVAAR